MIVSHPALRLATLSMMLIVVLLGCSDEDTVTPFAPPQRTELWVAAGAEGELFGEIFDASTGQRTTRTDLTVRITPLPENHVLYTPENGNLGSYHSFTFKVNPSKSPHFQWWDPASSDGWKYCGTVDAYYAGNLSRPMNEVHDGVGTGPEMHCIRPGSYLFEIVYGTEDTVIQGSSFVVDYQQLEYFGDGGRVVNDSSDGFDYHVAKNPFSYERGGSAGSIIDLVVNVELNGNAATSHGTTPATNLFIDNAGGDVLHDPFVPNQTAAGFTISNFRYTVRGSEVSWMPTDTARRGRALAKYWWNALDSSAPQTGYRDPNANWTLQQFRYGVHGEGKSSVWPGVDIKAPDQHAVLTPTITRRIDLGQYAPNVTDTCGAAEASATTINSWFVVKVNTKCFSPIWSQLLNSVNFGNGYTSPESADTIIQFQGYATPGTYKIVLKTRNPSTGSVGFDTIPITVLGNGISVSGPTLVKDKQVKTYYASDAGHWYERFPSDVSFRSATSGPATATFSRIWPATSTQYEVDIMDQTLSSGTLSRGSLRIKVCKATFTGCGVEPTTAINAVMTAAIVSGSNHEYDDWALFGGGPILSWGTADRPHVVRMYDLLGQHAPNTQFGAKSGLLRRTPGDVIGFDRGILRWSVDSLSTKVRRFAFAVTPPEPGTVFSLSLDFDVGEHAWDDRAGYDRERGLLYAFDGNGYVGLAIIGAGGNAIKSVAQFGARRFSPTLDLDIWRVQRKQDIDLLDTADDVQFIVSTAPISQETRYTGFLIRANSLKELRSLADGSVR